ncbi:MAG: zinc ribbon domain-containing protein [Anaerolineae bacterium]
MAQLLQLYQLQSIDSEIDQIRQQLKEIIGQIGESEALRQAKNRQQLADAALRRSQAKMQDLELELKSLSQKISGQEKLLYSGKVLNPKEAANLQDEVASLKRRQSDREEHLLEAMVAVEEAEAEFEGAAAHLNAVEIDWAAGQKELQQNSTQLKSRLLELKERRPAMVATVDPAILPIYERLRPKKGGRAVVAVKGGVCQGCGMTPSNNRLQQARAGTELVYCGACGRILYVP